MPTLKIWNEKLIVASIGVFGATLCGAPPVWAQSGGKSHAKPEAAESKRVTREKLGISYVAPEGYSDNLPLTAPALTMEGKRTNSTTGLAEYSGANYDVKVVGYIRTGISVSRQPDKEPNMPPFPYTTDAAKSLLDAISAMHAIGGNPLNYQNSAKIEVAGHEALAVLAETSVTGLSDRAFVRLVLLRHRGRLYIFAFQSIDAEFETRVPAFEKFMSTVKFLQPDVEPPMEAAKPDGPINITISK